MAGKGKKTYSKPKEYAKPKESIIEVMKEKVVEIKAKTPLGIKVTYLGGNIRHSGRTHSDYQFTGGNPVSITLKDDIKFFNMKAKNNPEIWKVE